MRPPTGCRRRRDRWAISIAPGSRRSRRGSARASRPIRARRFGPISIGSSKTAIIPERRASSPGAGTRPKDAADVMTRGVGAAQDAHGTEAAGAAAGNPINGHQPEHPRNPGLPHPTASAPRSRTRMIAPPVSDHGFRALRRARATPERVQHGFQQQQQRRFERGNARHPFEKHDVRQADLNDAQIEDRSPSRWPSCRRRAAPTAARRAGMTLPATAPAASRRPLALSRAEPAQADHRAGPGERRSRPRARLPSSGFGAVARGASWPEEERRQGRRRAPA